MSIRMGVTLPGSSPKMFATALIAGPGTTCVIT